MICKEIPLWKEGEYQGRDENFRPVMDTYILKDRKRDDESIPLKKKGAVLICPGGGYEFTSHREAEPIAMQFNAMGYHAFVLFYDVAPNIHPQPLKDATRAMCIIRDNAEEWNVDPEKIAVIGFSAGGHLAASLGILADLPELQDVPGMQPGKNRPNAMILSYPVIIHGEKGHDGSFRHLLGENYDTMHEQLSLEKHVTPATPKAFIWHTFEDGCVPVESALELAYALRRNRVPFEMHIFEKGGHGMSLANDQVSKPEDCDTHVAHWVKLCEEWLGKTF